MIAVTDGLAAPLGALPPGPSLPDPLTASLPRGGDGRAARTARVGGSGGASRGASHTRTRAPRPGSSIR
jgi:hypothetical protein